MGSDGSMETPVLKNKTFLIVWIGQSISVLGDNLFGLAMMWWVVKETGSGLAMSASGLAYALPRIFLGPLAGVLIDRYDRRKLMIAANAALGLVTLGMALCHWSGVFSLPLVLGVQIVMALFTLIHGPAFEAVIPNIVGTGQLVRANSLMQSAYSAIGIVVPAASGLIIGLTGVGASIFLDSITFFVAAVSLLVVQIASPERERSEEAISIWRESGLGFSYIFGSKLLFPLLIYFALVNLSLSPMSVALPFLVTDVLKKGPEVMGFLGSFQSAGVLVTSTLLASFPRLLHRAGLSVILSIMGIGGATALIGFVPHLGALFAGGFLSGMSSIAANVASQAIWQTEVQDEVRGRVYSARYALGSGLRPLGLAVSGVLVDFFGPSMTIGGAGLVCLIGGLSGFLVPGLAAYVPRQWQKKDTAGEGVSKS